MELLSDRLLSARQLLSDDDDSPVAHGPDHVSHLRRIIRKVTKRGVVLYARISDPRPGSRDTTSAQLKAAQDYISSLEQEFGVRIKIHDTFSEAVSGSEFSKRGRSELVKAAKLARDLKAVLVAFDPSRFVRNEDYQQLPTVADYEAIGRLVGNVHLATIADPEIHEDRSRSVKRGKKVDKSPGYMVRRREEFKSQVQELFAKGTPKRAIGRMLGLPRKTVSDWCPKA